MKTTGTARSQPAGGVGAWGGHHSMLACSADSRQSLAVHTHTSNTRLIVCQAVTQAFRYTRRLNADRRTDGQLN